MSELKRAGGAELLDQLPTDRLVEQGQLLLALLAERVIEKAVGPVEELAERLIDYAQHGGPGLLTAITGGPRLAGAKPPIGATVKSGIAAVSESVKQAFSGVGGPGKNGRVAKTVSIIEQIDVDVPVRVSYGRWSQFQEFSQFMKKVSAVEKTSDETSSWKVQVLWSHRAWEATIIEQVPDERIAWRSDGAKCRVDGAVSFHAVTPTMTRILVVLEYYPWGLLERTGNLWHAQARRVRLELEQFRRHVMTRAVLDPDYAPTEDGLDPVAQDGGGDRAEEPDGDHDDHDDGYDSDDHDPDGYDPDGYDPDGYDPDGYDPDNDPDEYEPDDDYEDEPERVAARSGGGNR